MNYLGGFSALELRLGRSYCNYFNLPICFGLGGGRGSISTHSNSASSAHSVPSSEKSEAIVLNFGIFLGSWRLRGRSRYPHDPWECSSVRSSHSALPGSILVQVAGTRSFLGLLLLILRWRVWSSPAHQLSTTAYPSWRTLASRFVARGKRRGFRWCRLIGGTSTY